MLEGVRVIDCASELSGSVAAMLMAEAGAEVIKIEPPLGDRRRGGAAFAAWNRSKTSIALDLAGPDSAHFLNLLAGAHVLIHDASEAEAVRLGLDRDTLARAAPHLVCARVRSLPEGSDDGDLPLDDMLVLAQSGVLAEQPAIHRDGPTWLCFPMASWSAAWLTAVGIAARLASAQRGGGPGPIDTSLLQGALLPSMMLWRHASMPTATFDGRIDRKVLPSLFECADGVWLHLMRNVDDTPLMKQLLEAMGRQAVAAANAEWPAHFRYTNWGANVRAFRSRPSAEWLADLWAADVPVQPALPMGALYADAQAALNAYVVEVDDAELGPVRQPGHPVTLTPPARVRNPAPRLDGDRAAILERAASPQPAPPCAGRDAGAHGKPLLDGIKVIDFGNYLAGPLSTMLLADLGAEVIKVEPPGGDPMRSNESAFLGCQRGKRSIVLDLRRPDAGPIVQRLVAGADIVHHNLRLPAARRFRLDYETLKAIKPDLVYGHVSAYGPQGPRRDWPGYDQLFQAATGWELANAGSGNRPTWLRYGMMDHLCALSLCWGMLLALRKRDATGEGSEVAASLLGASVMTMAELAMRPDGSLTGPAPALDRAQMGPSPGRRVTQCQDGWIAFVGPDADAPEAGHLAEMESSEALALLRTRGFAATRVREDAGQAFLFDPRPLRQGLVARYPHPIYGELRHPGGFWTMPDAPLRLDRAPPALGQHSAEILAELGFASEEIERFTRDGLVGLPDQDAAANS